MPALNNPRYERFAQALFAGLAGETRVKRAQSTAYLTAYPNCSNGNSAEAAASRLLRRVKPILERVRELQAESMARQQHSIDLSRDRVGRDLDLAFRTAKEQGNATAMVSSALGIAKVFHSVPNEQDNAFSFKSATSMHDFGRKLLTVHSSPVNPISEDVFRENGTMKGVTPLAGRGGAGVEFASRTVYLSLLEL